MAERLFMPGRRESHPSPLYAGHLESVVDRDLLFQAQASIPDIRTSLALADAGYKDFNTEYEHFIGVDRLHEDRSFELKAWRPKMAFHYSDGRPMLDLCGTPLLAFQVKRLDEEGLRECYSAWVDSWPQTRSECFKKKMRWAYWFLDLVARVCMTDDGESIEELQEKISDQLLIVSAAAGKLTTRFLPKYASTCGIELFAHVSAAAAEQSRRPHVSADTDCRMIGKVQPFFDKLPHWYSDIPQFAIPRIVSFGGRLVGLLLRSPKTKALPKDSTSSVAPSTTPMDPIPTVESVIEDVAHEELAEHVSPHEAATLVETRWASWLQHNADAAEVLAPRGSMEDTHFEPVYLLCITRATKKWQERLYSCGLLETIRAALSDEGHGMRLPSGAALIVVPDQYVAVRHLLASEELRPWHVVVSESLLPLVLEVVHDMPCRSNTRVRSSDVLAYMANNACESCVAVTVEKTFLSVPRPMRHASSIVQSTGDAHGVQNPRRSIPTMALSDV